jgi:hypothetical protein
VKANISSRLQTDTPLLKDLIADIRKGQIKVPQFQRRFVWREPQAFNLLDSIANNYPVGSLLLWRTSALKLAVERNIGDFTLPTTDDLSPTDYVLDGQQRLTVIYSCLGAPHPGPGFAAAFDLLTEEFVAQPEAHAAHQFPVRLLYETTRLLNFRTGLISHPEGPKLQERLDRLIDVLTGYRIPVVILKELTVEEVCPIFERINSSGTRLSTYDLMVAATWSLEFSLHDEALRISEALSGKGFGDISGDTVLKCLAAIHSSSIKREKVLGLRALPRADMDALVERTKEALLAAVDLLVTEFRLYSWDFLPYEAIIVILAFIFARRRTLTREDIVRVRQWFWQSSLSERYRGASEAYVSKDLAAIEKFVISGEPAGSTFGAPPDVAELGRLGFRADNSRSRAFVLSLACLEPRNLTNGVRIDTAEALSAFNKKQFHHIFPLAHLRRTGAPGEANALANICILAASENRLISDRDPNAYVPELIAQHGSDADAILASNLLPSSAFPYATAKYGEFNRDRAALLSAHLEALCAGALPAAKLGT